MASFTDYSIDFNTAMSDFDSVSDSVNTYLEDEYNNIQALTDGIDPVTTVTPTQVVQTYQKNTLDEIDVTVTGTSLGKLFDHSDNPTGSVTIKSIRCIAEEGDISFLLAAGGSGVTINLDTGAVSAPSGTLTTMEFSTPVLSVYAQGTVQLSVNSVTHAFAVKAQFSDIEITLPEDGYWMHLVGSVNYSQTAAGVPSYSGSLTEFEVTTPSFTLAYEGTLTCTSNTNGPPSLSGQVTGISLFSNDGGFTLRGNFNVNKSGAVTGTITSAQFDSAEEHYVAAGINYNITELFNNDGTINLDINSDGSTDLEDLKQFIRDEIHNTSQVFTNDTTPTFTGTGLTAGDTVTIFSDTNNNGILDPGEKVLGTAIVAGDGSWSATPTTAMAAGVYNIGENIIGPDGSTSDVYSLVIDTTADAAPGAPKLNGGSESGISNTDNIISTSSPIFEGSGLISYVGHIVQVFDDVNNNGKLDPGELLGTAMVAGDGAWTVSSGNVMGDGKHSIKANLVDLAGNASASSAALTITIDTEALPPTLDLVTASDTGLSNNDNNTTDTTPTFTAKAEAGAAVQLYYDGGLVATTTVGSTGIWTITPLPLAEGVHNLTAVQTDIAGNASSPSAPLAVTIDLTADGAPGTPDLAAGSDSGVSDTDNITSVTKPTFTGSGLTAGHMVQVFKDTNNNGKLDAGELLGTATVAGDGSWSVTSTVALAAGTYNIKADVIDLAGNVSASSAALPVTIDTSKPAAPTSLDLATSSDTGLSSTDNLTSDTTPTISGKGETGTTVTLFRDTNNNGVADAGEGLGTAAVAGGVWSIDSSALADGTYSLKAVQTDAAGNISPASAPLTITIDTTAAAPTAMTLAAASDSGLSSTDGNTTDTTPTVTGHAEAGATVTLSDGATVLGTAIAGSTGVWSITPGNALALAEGVHNLTAVQTDIAGNASSPSAPLAVTIDLTADGAPGTPDLAAGSDSGVSDTDNITSVTKPTFTGSGLTAGHMVQVFKDTNNNGKLDAGELLGTATVAGDGSWSVTSTVALAAGTYNIKADVIDLAGNVSASSAALPVTIDTSKPAAPTSLDLATSSDTGLSSTDNLTSDTTPTISGKGETGTTVTLFRDTNNNGVADAGEGLGTAAVAGGVWSIDSSALADGTYSLKAVQTDAAGNISPASAPLTITIDTTAAAPTAMTLAAASDSGLSSTDGNTTDTTPTVTGHAEAGATVTLSDGATVLGTAIAGSTGVWSITPGNALALAEGVHNLTAVQTDIAGNASSPSAPLAVTIDLTADGAPGTPDLAAGSDSGVSDTDNITSVTKPTFTGSGLTAGHMVQVFKDTNNNGKLDAGELLGTATVAGDGSWSVTSTVALAAGTYNIKADVIDLAGNVSASSAALPVTIDTSKPAAPTSLDLATSSDTGLSSTDNLTSDTTPTISGKGETGTTVTLFRDTNNNGVADAGEGLGTAAVAGGVWSIDSSALADGTYSLKAVQTDAAGNISPASAPLTITIDTTAAAPTAMTLAAASDSGLSSTDGNTTDTTPTVTGHAEAGATVTLSDGATVLGTAIAGSTGVWSITPGNALALAEGVHNLTAVQTDIAGNASSPSAPLAVTIDLTADGAPGTPDLAAGSDSGVSDTDNITSVTKPTFTGSGLTAGHMVQVFKDTNNNGKLDAGELLGTATVAGDGSWSVTSTVALAAGTYNIKADVIDLAGNVSASSAALPVTIDTSKPAAPTSLDLATSSDTGLSSTDNLTSDTTPTISGKGETGTTVTLFRDTNNNGVADAGEGLGTAAVAGGVWSIDSSALADGTYSLKAVQTDAAGNISPASAPLTITIDTTAAAPTAMTLAAASDSGLSSTDGNTTDTTPTVTGHAEAGATVTLSDGATVLGTAIAGSTGVWSITPGNALALAEGVHNLTAVQTDIAGNASSPSAPLAVTIDLTADGAPGTPDLAAGSDSGVSDTDNITSVTKPTFTGSGLTAGHMVQVFKDTNNNGKLDAGELLGTATVAGDGSWSVTSTVALAAGTYNIKADVIDLAGNVSASSAALPVTIDTSKPAAPTSLDLATSSDTGLSSTDNLTSDTTPTISGKGETGTTVTLFRDTNNNGVADAGEGLGTAAVAGGIWSIDSSALADGTYSLKAVQTDAAGNISPASAPLTITIDTTADAAPAAPDLAASSDTGLSNTDNITGDTTPTFTGSGLTAGHTVQVFNDLNNDGHLDLGELLGTATVAANGSWSVTAAPAMALGDYTSIKADVVDPAGNVSAASAALSMSIVGISATAPTLQSATIDGSILTLTYDQTLDSSQQPSSSYFLVQVNHGASTSTYPISSLAISGDTATLTLSKPVAASESVTVSYADPTTGNDAYALQNFTGVDAGNLANIPVTNSTVESNTSPFKMTYEKFTSGSNAVLTLNFSKGIQAANAMAGWTLLKMDSSGTVTSVNITSAGITGNALTLHTNANFAATDWLKISYSGGSLTDMFGNSFTGLDPNNGGYTAMLLGGSGANPLDLSSQLPGYSTGYFWVNGEGGNDTLYGGDNNKGDIISGSSGADTIYGGGGPDSIYLTDGTTPSTDILAVNYDGWGHGVEKVYDFDVSHAGGTKNDVLVLPSGTIAANTAPVTGTAVNGLARYSISKGILTFLDGSGNPVLINKENLVDAENFLMQNITVSGVTVAVAVDTDDSGAADSLAVFQNSGYRDSDDALVLLKGVNGVTLSNTAGQNVVQVGDGAGPQLSNVSFSGKTISLEFNENIVFPSSSTGTPIYLNGDTNEITIPNNPVVNKNVMTLTAAQSLLPTDWLLLTTTADVKDTFGNPMTAGKRVAVGGNGDNTIDLSSYGDSIYISGGDGNDTLTASNSGCTLWGGTGGDILTGGTGNDEFFFFQGDSTAVAFIDQNNNHLLDANDTFTFTGGVDTINGFSGSDDIHFNHPGNNIEPVTDIAAPADGLTLDQKYFLVQGSLSGSTFTAGAGSDTLVVYDGDPTFGGVSQTGLVIKGVAPSSLTTNGNYITHA